MYFNYHDSEERILLDIRELLAHIAWVLTSGEYKEVQRAKLEGFLDARRG